MQQIAGAVLAFIIWKVLLFAGVENVPALIIGIMAGGLVASQHAEGEDDEDEDQ